MPLLPDDAQWTLGQLQPVAELPFHILMDEGLDGETHLTLFDGVPTADGRVALLKTVARRRALQATLVDGSGATGTGWQLVANALQADFRAMLLPASHSTGLALPTAAAQALAARGRAVGRLAGGQRCDRRPRCGSRR